MADDFAGDASTIGRYSVFDEPMVIRSDFDGLDSDWIRVNLTRFTDYSIVRYPVSGSRPPRYGGSRLAIYDTASQRVVSLNSGIPGTVSYHHEAQSGDYFFDSQSRRQVEGEDSYYNFYVRAVDLAGDEFADALEFVPNEIKGKGARIDTNTDLDWYSFDLAAGKEYTIHVFGGSSTGRGTTLADPLLQLYDAGGGLVTFDNNSGNGTDAKLVYTPSVTETFRLRVSGNGTQGTYFLYSNQFDDYSAEVEDAPLIALGETVSGRVDYEGDKDTFKFEVEKGAEYEFNLSGASGYLLDVDGYFSRTLNHIYVPEESGEIHVVVEGSSPSDWELVVGKADTVGETNSTSRVVNSSVEYSTIDFAGDRDRFEVGLWSDAIYTIQVVGEGGEPVANPGLAIRNGDGEFISYEADGSYLLKTSFEETNLFGNPFESYYADVLAPGGGTGLYGLRVRAIDRTPGDTSTTWTVGFKDGKAEIRDMIESISDVDFYRIKLKANSWYSASKAFGSSTVTLRSPDGSESPIYFGSSPTQFFTEVAGDYYIINEGGNNDYGSFRMSVLEDARPAGPTGDYIWSIGDPFNGINQNQRLTKLFPDFYRVISDVDMTYLEDGFVGSGLRKSLPAGEMRVINRAEWASMLPPPGDRIGELYSQGIPNIDNPAEDHNWGNVAVSRRPFPTQIIGDSDRNRYQGVFEFSQELPDYLAGDPRFSGFTPVTATEGQVLKDIGWDWAYKSRRVGFFAVEDNSGYEPDMQIFKAALNTDDHVLAFPNGYDIGGDIIINTNSSVMSDLTPGGQGYFELIRAMGTVANLSETTAYTLTQSVMGNRGTLEAGMAYPSTPMPYDAIAIRQDSDLSPHHANPDDVFSLVSDVPFVKMVAAGPNEDELRVITAEGSALDSRIDLRAGEKSFSKVGDEAPYLYVNSYYSYLLGAIGGEGNDALVGNHYDNTLRGNGGNDLLRGGAGDDQMFGGAGDDFYQFRPGYGQDVIDEEGGGGNDILRIEGSPVSGGLYQNMTFEKLGNDLVVRLELLERPNRFGDTVTIKNMASAESRVETLTILDGTGQATAWIDLASVFDQLADPRQRFQITLDKTEFGHLTVPVG